MVSTPGANPLGLQTTLRVQGMMCLQGHNPRSERDIHVLLFGKILKVERAVSCSGKPRLPSTKVFAVIFEM